MKNVCKSARSIEIILVWKLYFQISLYYFLQLIFMEYLLCPKHCSSTLVYERGKALLSGTLYSRILIPTGTEEQIEEGQGLEMVIS